MNRKITDAEDIIIRNMATQIAHALNMEMYNQLEELKEQNALELPKLVTQGMVLDYVLGFVQVTLIEILKAINIPPKLIRKRLEIVLTESMRHSNSADSKKFIRNSPFAKPSEIN